jgi:hypothetical protein
VVVIATKQVAVKPIYGWGWSESDNNVTQAVPEAFTTEVEQFEEHGDDRIVKTLLGYVVEQGHEFDGYSVELSPRNTLWDGCVNVALKSDDSRQVYGFAEIEIASFK